jgi:hypothetical protein
LCIYQLLNNKFDFSHMRSHGHRQHCKLQHNSLLRLKHRCNMNQRNKTQNLLNHISNYSNSMSKVEPLNKHH